MSLYTALFYMKQEKKSMIKDMEEKIQKQDEKMNNYGTMIEDFSTFNSEDIIYILTRLVSMCESEEYVPTIINNDHVNRKMELNESAKSLVVVAKYSTDDLNNSSALRLFGQKRAAIILTHFIEGENIKFFSYDSESKTINITPGVFLYPYIGKFIEAVVSYRIENELENIDKATLETLLESFFAEKQNVIDEEQERMSASEAKSASVQEQPKKNLEQKQPRIFGFMKGIGKKR